MNSLFGAEIFAAKSLVVKKPEGRGGLLRLIQWLHRSQRKTSLSTALRCWPVVVPWAKHPQRMSNLVGFSGHPQPDPLPTRTPIRIPKEKGIRWK